MLLWGAEIPNLAVHTVFAVDQPIIENDARLQVGKAVEHGGAVRGHVDGRIPP